MPGCIKCPDSRTLTGNFGSVSGAEAVREDALTEVALGGGVGVLVDCAGRLVGSILAVAGVAVAKEILRRSDSDSPVHSKIKFVRGQKAKAPNIPSSLRPSLIRDNKPKDRLI